MLVEGRPSGVRSAGYHTAVYNESSKYNTAFDPLKLVCMENSRECLFIMCPNRAVPFCCRRAELRSVNATSVPVHCMRTDSAQSRAGASFPHAGGIPRAP